jgi:hypothetical protein
MAFRRREDVGRITIIGRWENECNTAFILQTSGTVFFNANTIVFK